MMDPGNGMPPTPGSQGWLSPYPEWQGRRKGRSQGQALSRGFLTAAGGNYGTVSATPGTGGGMEGRAWLIMEQVPGSTLG